MCVCAYMHAYEYIFNRKKEEENDMVAEVENKALLFRK